jgi:hypothetical protein
MADRTPRGHAARSTSTRTRRRQAPANRFVFSDCRGEQTVASVGSMLTRLMRANRRDLAELHREIWRSAAVTVVFRSAV